MGKLHLSLSGFQAQVILKQEGETAPQSGRVRECLQMREGFEGEHDPASQNIRSFNTEVLVGLQLLKQGECHQLMESWLLSHLSPCS